MIRCKGLWNERNPSDSRVLVWGSEKVVELFNNLWRKTEGLVLRTRQKLNKGYFLMEMRSEKALNKQQKEMVQKGLRTERRPSINVSAGKGVNKEVECCKQRKMQDNLKGKANIYEIKLVCKKREYRNHCLKVKE